MNGSVVDERVVEMKFDNSNFEKNVQTSMHTLDELKEHLKFKDGTDGIDDLANSLGKLNGSGYLDSIGNAVDSLGNKFNAMSIIGMTAIANLTNKVVDSMTTMVKSLTVDQLAAGWQKYDDKTKAVQTIVAATGKSMETISEQLDKLMWYTDETSYDFVDMTGSIGKFTSNGIELEDAVTAMEGISNWAAISGQTKQQASMAMYNLSQSLSMGAVKVQDWKSIELANMATKEFKETAMETAVAVGELKKEYDSAGKAIYYYEKTTSKGTTKEEVTAENFRTTLADGWFTSDVLTSTLKVYGDFATELSNIYDGMPKGDDTSTSEWVEWINSFKDGKLTLEEINDIADETGYTAEEVTGFLTKLSDTAYDLGRRAFAAAQEAKTFAEAIDSAADAVSSKLMKMFELIFGNYEQAKKTWTDLANDLWTIFAGPLESINIELEGANEPGSKLERTLTELGYSYEEFTTKYLECVNRAARNKGFGDNLFNIEAIEEAYGSLEHAIEGGLFDDILGNEHTKKNLFENVLKQLGLAPKDSENATETVANAEEALKKLNEAAQAVWNGDYGIGEERNKHYAELGFKTDDAQAWNDILIKYNEWKKGASDQALTEEDLKKVYDLNSAVSETVEFIEADVSAYEALKEQADKAGNSVYELAMNMNKTDYPTIVESVQNGITNILDIIKAIVLSARDAKAAIFPAKEAEDYRKIAFAFDNITNSVAELVAAFTGYDRETEKVSKDGSAFKSILMGILIPLKLVTGAIDIVMAYLPSLVDITLVLFKPLFDIARFIGNIVKALQYEFDILLPVKVLLAGLFVIVNSIVGVFEALYDTLYGIFSLGAIRALSSSIQEFKQAVTSGSEKFSYFIERLSIYLLIIKNYFASDVFANKVRKNFEKLKGYISAGFAPILDFFSFISEKFKDFPIIKQIRTLGETIKRIDKNASYTNVQKLKLILDAVRRTLKDIGHALGIDKLKEFFTGLWTKGSEGIAEGQNTFIAKLEAIKKKIHDFCYGSDGAFILFENIKKKLKEVFGWFTKPEKIGADSNSQKGESGVAKFFKDSLQAIVKAVSGITLDDVLGVFLKIYAMLRLIEHFRTVINVRKMMGGLADTFEGIGGILKTINDKTDKAAKKSILFRDSLPTAILKIAGSIALIAYALKIMSDIDADRLTDSMKKLGIIVVGFVGMYAALALVEKKIGGVNIKMGFGVGILAFVGALALLVYVYIKLDSKIDELKHPERTRNILLSLIIGLAAVGFALGKAKMSFGAGLGMLAFIGSLALLIRLYKNLSDVIKSVDNPWATSIALVAIISGLCLAAFALGKSNIKFGNGVALLSFVGALTLLVFTYKKMYDFCLNLSYPAVEDTNWFLLRLLIFLVLAAGAMGMFRPSLRSGLAMVLFVGALALLAGVYMALVKMIAKTGSIRFVEQARAIILDMVLGLVLASITMGLFQPKIRTGVAMLLFCTGLTLILAAFCAVLKMTKDISAKRIQVLGDIFNGMIIAIGVLMVLIGLTTKLMAAAGFKALIGSLSVVVLVYALLEFFKGLAEILKLDIDFREVKWKLLTLGIAVTALAIVIGLIGLLGPALALGGLGVFLAGGGMWLFLNGLTSFLDTIKDIEPGTLDDFCTDLRNGLKALEGLNAINYAGGLLVIGAFVGEAVWAQIGSGIATFFGASLPEFAAGLQAYTEVLPEIRKNLEEWNFDASTKVRYENGISVIKGFADAMTEADLKNNPWILQCKAEQEAGNNETMKTFADGLAAYAKALPKIRRALRGWEFDDDQVTSFLNGITVLRSLLDGLSEADISNNVTTVFSTAEEQAGGNNETMKTFASGMMAYARALPKIRKALKGWDITNEDKESFINGLSILNGLLITLSNADAENNTQWWFTEREKEGGNNETMQTFGKGMEAYATGMAAIATSMREIVFPDDIYPQVDKAITNLLNVVTLLTDADKKNNISSGFAGIFEWLGGEGEGANNNTMITFADGMEAYGRGLTALRTAVDSWEMSDDLAIRIQNGIGILTDIMSSFSTADKANNISGWSRGFYEWLSGEGEGANNATMETFASGMEAYGRGISSMSAAVKQWKITDDDEKQIGRGMKILNSVLGDLNRADDANNLSGFWEWFTRDSGKNNETMQTFAAGMSAYAGGILQMSIAMHNLQDLDLKKAAEDREELGKFLHQMLINDLGNDKKNVKNNQSLIDFADGVTEYAGSLIKIKEALDAYTGLNGDEMNNALSQIRSMIDELNVFIDTTDGVKIKQLVAKFEALTSDENLAEIKRRACELALSPTLSDGFPTVEASWTTSANALVAAFVGTIDSKENREICQTNGKTLVGYLCSGVTAEKESMKSALYAIMTDAETYKDMGNNAAYNFCVGFMSDTNTEGTNTASAGQYIAGLIIDAATAIVNEYTEKAVEAAITIGNALAEQIKTKIEENATIEPTIRPVLDMSNVKQGAGFIDSVLSGSYGVFSKAATFLNHQNGSDQLIVSLDDESLNYIRDDIATAVSEGVATGVTNAMNNYPEQGITINIDGRSIANTVTRYQRLSARMKG